METGNLCRLMLSSDNMINYNMMNRKKKGIMEKKVEKSTEFEKNVETQSLFFVMTEMRREIAFILIR